VVWEDGGGDPASYPIMREKMKTKKVAVIIIALLVSLVASHVLLHAAEAEKHNSTPAAGYVPDEETAIAIAVAIWTPIYGKDRIEDKKPYKAILKGGVWHVRGSLPKGWKGGVPEAEINKDDGRILRVWHGK